MKTGKIMGGIFLVAFCTVLFGCAAEQESASQPGTGSGAMRPSFDQYMKSNEDENLRETGGRGI